MLSYLIVINVHHSFQQSDVFRGLFCLKLKQSFTFEKQETENLWCFCFINILNEMNQMYDLMNRLIFKSLIECFSHCLVQTGGHGCGCRERSSAHLEGFTSSRFKETLHQGTQSPPV